MLTEQQQQIRRTGLGGSDIAAISSLSKWQSPLEVYLQKVGITDPRDQEYNDAMRFGDLLEDVVASEYARRMEVCISNEPETLRHPEHSFMLANIDRWVGDEDFILECKTAHIASASLWGEPMTDQIPQNYLCQVAWYCAVCDKPRADIAVLIGGSDFRIYTYTRDLEFEKKLFMLAYNFWHNHVLKEVPPDALHYNDPSLLYPEDLGSEIEASWEIAEAVEQLKNFKAQQKLLDEEVKALQLKVQSYMSTAARLVNPQGDTIATWKNYSPRQGFDLKKFKQDKPDIYNGYIKVSKPARVFLIK